MPVRNARIAVSLFAASSFALSLPAPARAGEQRPIAVLAAPLDRAIAVLAQQAGVDIGSAEPGLARVMARGVQGRMTAAAALDRLLAGTPFVAQRIDAGTFRIVRRAVVRPVRHPVEHAAPPPPSTEAPPEVVVTATKRNTSQLRFPGAFTILRPGAPRGAGGAVAGTMDQAIAATPILQGTALGAGRNKLFIRGVADSSFTGPTQSTAAVYYGEVPVAYNGPDPGLNLYDMQQVEVLEGPQGTLYGAGAIGGIVRLVPNPVDVSRVAATAAVGASATQSGGLGGDLAGMINLPVLAGVVGMRAVGYHVVEGGYIDDVRRGETDVNRVTTTGGRLDLRAEPIDGWTIDAGIVAQSIKAPDLQYAERGMRGLSRASFLAQPFDQQYLLGRIVIDRRWDDGLHLVSATGLVRRDAASRFDATRLAVAPVTIAYDTDERSRLFSHETRLSRSGANGAGWLVGIALVHARDAYARRYGQPDRLRDIVGVTNRTRDVALFGEAGVAFGPALTITAGGRLTHQRTDGDPIASLRTTNYIRGRSTTQFDPTLGASWLVAPGVAAYARYQSAFRTGGITVAPGIGRVADLVPDTIRVAEIGIRKDRHGALGVAASAGLSLTDWHHVQADVIDRFGFPYTTNLGDTQFHGVEGNIDWVPVRGLQIAAAMFLNDTQPPDQDPARRRPGASVPNTPRVAGSGSVGYDWSIGATATAGIDTGLRYVGRSTVGTQAPLDLSQGNYAVAHLGGYWTRGSVRLTTTIENLFDGKGDRFAGGNPFALATRDEYTPLRPRTIRLGAAIAW